MGYKKGQVLQFMSASSPEKIEQAIYELCLFRATILTKTDIAEYLNTQKIATTGGKRFTTADVNAHLVSLLDKKKITKIYHSGSDRFGLASTNSLGDSDAMDLIFSGRLKELGESEFLDSLSKQFEFPSIWYSQDRQFGILRWAWATGSKAVEALMEYRGAYSSRVEPYSSEQYRRIFPADRIEEMYNFIDNNLQNEMVNHLISISYGPGIEKVIALLDRVLKKDVRSNLTFNESYLFHFVGTSDREGAKSLFGEESFSYKLFDGLTALLELRGTDASSQLTAAVAMYRKVSKKRAFVPEKTVGAIWLLLLWAENREREFTEEFERFKKQNKYYLSVDLPLSAASTSKTNGTTGTIDSYSYYCAKNVTSPFDAIPAVLGQFVARRKCNNQLSDELLTLAGTAESCGYVQLAKFLGEGVQAKGIPLDGKLFKKVENWELLMRRLEELADGTSAAAKESSVTTKRLAWYLSWSDDFQHFQLDPFEQSLQKKGWSAGKKVALKRLKTNTGDLSFLIPQDMAIIKAIRKESGGWYGDTFFNMEMAKAWPALIGHPHLFCDQANGQISVERKEPQLIVEKKSGRVELKIDPAPGNRVDGFYTITRSLDGNTLYYTAFTAEIRDLHKLISGENSIPAEALPQIEKLVGKLSRVITVGGNVASADIKLERGDSSVKVRCTPQDGGLLVSLIVIPSEATGAVVPGTGTEILQVRKGTKPVQIQRDLKAELKSAKAILAACESLIPHKSFSWYLADLNEQLSFLSQLKTVTPQPEILWPEGKNLEVSAPVSAKGLKISVNGTTDWLELDGLVKIGEKEEITLSEILSKMQESNGSRFIALSDRKFLAITEKLRKQLDLLAGVSKNSKKKVELHPLALLASAELIEESSLTDKKKLWETVQDRWERSVTHQTAVPQALEATLRPYQEEGFFWASRLAAGGFGACLADDMGLGKTVQSIALLLERHDSSALVVAPTSLINVWHREILRFAPTLKTVVIGASDATVPVCSAGTVTITSYGVLMSREEQFVEHHWHTLIIDEAQAIKNSAAKRTKTVKNLKADFRLACTGTPVENHTGELWSLFDFLVPGLLGTSAQFAQRFSSSDSVHRLKALVKPFILRRRKSEVLKELPAKTEIILPVTLTDDERKRYDAVRFSALNDIESNDGENNRFSILANLTKLRQACCHPALLDSTYQGRSSKLEMLAEEIGSLRENGHRALIFSQFVSHLKIVKEWCDEMNISYQYLDGSTSQKERAASVESFQNGNSELFLISLKAGGTGLTLTAADYVFILDPWWNPAVEDQAADRTHRIGQTRPVTVYRLVAENSVEEKIMELHAGKRELTDALLSETGTASALSQEELLDLFRG